MRLAALVCAFLSCSRVPEKKALLTAAAQKGRYNVEIVSYDVDTRLATLRVRAPDRETTSPIYHWYEFDGKRWQRRPMVGARCPTR